jgi:hypothetical protein
MNLLGLIQPMSNKVIREMLGMVHGGGGGGLGYFLLFQLSVSSSYLLYFKYSS